MVDKKLRNRWDMLVLTYVRFLGIIHSEMSSEWHFEQFFFVEANHSTKHIYVTFT